MISVSHRLIEKAFSMSCLEVQESKRESERIN